MASKVKYKINLLDVFNRAYSTSSASFRAKARQILSDPNFRRNYGLSVIEEIRKRTSDEKIDKHGDSLGKYSEEYAESLAGQVYGKTKGGRVNLWASGEMLSSMRSQETAQTIQIDFVDQFNNDKAHGHINGYINQDPRLVRDFLGLPAKDEEKLLKENINEFQNTSLINILADALEGAGTVTQQNQTVTAELDQDLIDLIGEELVS